MKYCTYVHTYIIRPYEHLQKTEPTDIEIGKVGDILMSSAGTSPIRIVLLNLEINSKNIIKHVKSLGQVPPQRM